MGRNFSLNHHQMCCLFSLKVGRAAGLWPIHEKLKGKRQKQKVKVMIAFFTLYSELRTRNSELRTKHLFENFFDPPFS